MRPGWRQASPARLGFAYIGTKDVFTDHGEGIVLRYDFDGVVLRYDMIKRFSTNHAGVGGGN